MDQNAPESSKRPTGLLIGGVILVVALILIGLFLPPISLGTRLGLGSTQSTTTEEAAAETEELTVAEVTTNAAPEGVVLSLTSGEASVAIAPQSEFLSSNPDSAPAGQLALVGDVYTLTYEGEAPQGQLALDIPADAGAYETLDLYGWENNAWTFLPSRIDPNSQQIVTSEGSLPVAVALMQVAAPETRTVAVSAAADQPLPGTIAPLVGEVSVGALRLGADGTLEGETPAALEGDLNQWIRVTNVGPVVDQASLSALLSNDAAQTTHIEGLVAAAADGGFDGIHLDYQKVPEGQREAFTAFVSALAEALHAQELSLVLTLATPDAAGSQWDTGGQDWAALGRVADLVYVNLPANPTLYDAGDQAMQLVDWSTRQIDRRKLNVTLTGAAVQRLGESYTTLANEEALANFGELQFVQGGEEVAPNETVEVALSGTASPLEWDGESLTYKYSYELDGQTYDVWLGSEAALSQRLQNVAPYNLRGVTVQGIGEVEKGAAYAAALGSFLGSADAPQPTGAAIVWTVRNENDSVLASESGNELTFSWDVGENEGVYTVNADFALGDNIASLDAKQVNVTLAAAEEEEAEEAVEEEAEATEAAAAETESNTAAADLGDADAVVNVGANVRTGPGLIYGTLSGGAEPGTELQLIGRSDDASWLNAILPDGTEGWIFASLVTVNPGVDVNALEVVQVAAPAAPAAAADAGADGGGAAAPAPAAAAPPPVAAAPVSNPGFELGGQSHSFGNPSLMSYAGMNWVKFQHKWNPGDDPNAVAGRIQQAHGSGFKVLLSIPGTPYPSSIDFQSYVDFLGGVAALGPDAIEVWNEMNIDFEWPAGQINPSSYVNNMLAPAYNAIKSANPNVMVISGAPAPTGFFGGGCSANGCDDSAYLAGMAAAGAASYMDCMGVHFNAGATPPGQASGHPAGGSHYSWYFQPMLDLYYNSLGKPVCFTELGYLSGDDFGGVPSRFSWAGNTSVSEHAQWLAEAVSLAANSGKTRLVIIFNVDFTQFGDDPQAGYAMIRPDGGCPACETLRQVMGR